MFANRVNLWALTLLEQEYLSPQLRYFWHSIEHATLIPSKLLGFGSH